MKRPFAPSFIDKLDEDLLLHRPDTWTTRIHLVLYYGLLFILFLAGVGFIVPFDPGAPGNLEVISVLLGILSVIALIFWLIYLLRFNVFKRYGQLAAGDSVKTFILFFICIGTFVIVPFVPSYVESLRANAKFGDEEIVRDLNSINTKLLQLEYDSVDRSWDATTYRVVNSYAERLLQNNNGSAPVQAEHDVIDTAGLRLKLAQADSVRKISDTVYVFYQCRPYRIIDPYDADTYTKTDFLTNVDLYNRVLKYYVRPDTAQVKKELLALLDKYDPDRTNVFYDYYSDDPYIPGVKRRYNLYYTEGRFNNIIGTKYRWRYEYPSLFLRIIYYVTLSLTLLVFIFRHSTVKTFFLSLLSAFILFSLSSLFVAVFAGSVGTPFVLIFSYFLVFGIIAFIGLGTRIRNVVSGIALNCLVFLTPFIPLVATGYYYWQLRMSRIESEETTYDPTLFENESIHHFYAEIGGVILLLVLIGLVFRKLYRNWYAKPEQ